MDKLELQERKKEVIKDLNELKEEARTIIEDVDTFLEVFNECDTQEEMKKAFSILYDLEKKLNHIIL